MNSFNLVDLYQKAFGIKGVRFNVSASQSVESANNTYFDIPGVESRLLVPGQSLSVLGTPIYEHFTFSYTEKGKTRSITLPDWPLMSVSAHKNILCTPIKGLPGTVKEFINFDDYKISIRGMLINYESNDYPEQLVHDLHDFFKINDQLVITSPILNNQLDVDAVVMESIDFPALEGFPNVQPYQIDMISDAPVIVTIRDAKKQVKNILPRK